MIFDWDGVVVDSTPLHALSWQRMAEQRGTRLPEGLRIGSLGVKTEYVVSDVLGWATDPEEVARLTQEKEALYRRLARERGQPSRPGLRRLLEGLTARGIPCAIGSSALRRNIEECIDALAFRPFFRVIVTGDEVLDGKPAPDIFLEVARRIEREPNECVVFEDSPAGISAAQAAGMRVIALLTTNSAAALLKADRQIHTFEDLGGSDPLAWFEPVPV
ncbi:MAG: HAD family phosphatase [Verrucomicrobia bacterium]|nr:HAD family phosphatase [Verrucomicrobiota bacterium]MBU1909096.1 HAD family phosphatase [Verrucomicrobiota bacterium]